MQKEFKTDDLYSDMKKESHLLSSDEMDLMDKLLNFTLPSLSVEQECLRRAIAQMQLSSITDTICCVCDLYIPSSQVSVLPITPNVVEVTFFILTCMCIILLIFEQH